MQTEVNAAFSPTNPAATNRAARDRVVVAGSADIYGAHSLETFSSVSALSYTHEDVKGFLDYPTSFPGNAANYWLTDASVQAWAYEEAYDNWQDTYGMDAVRVFYHSGHGGMDNNGVFQLPLGRGWDGRDWVFSSNMAFSNEELRYLFWSTCLSLRVFDGHSPIRTWWEPNRGGLRMLFGYETTSVDDPDYGKFFWEEWKTGKSFSRAFLDASWRISHDQIPSVMAVGENVEDARQRLNSERQFWSAPVGKGWYEWMWMQKSARERSLFKSVRPKDIAPLSLRAKFDDRKETAGLVRRLGVTRSASESPFVERNGVTRFTSSDANVSFDASGAMTVFFGEANIQNITPIAEDRAIDIARSFISSLDLDKGLQLELGPVRQRVTCGGTLKGSGEFGKPSVVETIVQYRQIHDGAASVNSSHGLVTVSIDNDGRVVNLFDATKRIEGPGKRSAATRVAPPGSGSAAQPDTEAQFRNKLRLIAGEKQSVTVLRDVVGYDYSTGVGHAVHQRDVEVDMGNNLKKRYKLRVPLV
jgi:Family of unknown function (DUF6345)